MSHLDLFRLFLCGVQAGLLVAEVVAYWRGENDLGLKYMLSVLGLGALVIVLGALK